ncbi:hypothetical protein B0H11DRAFT_1947694 [Mycena galericulata]|nr:hypothetical protein B0H11DRAFT_1947694 [Mycena galericulata]
MSVKELQARIETISADIAQQQKILNDLWQSKSQVQRQLNAVRDPVARLPPEISSEIFMQCLPSFPEPGAHNIPMLLLNICNTWTDIALSVPALWAAIHVVFPRTEGFRELLKTWFRRAHTRPLSVTISGPFDEEIAPVIWQHAGQRLKHLELSYEKEEQNDDSDEDEDEDEDEDADEDVDIFGCSSPGPLPLLETFTIRRSGWRRNLDQGPGYRGSQILELLRLAFNLVECTFDGMYPIVDDNHLQEPPVLSAMRRYSSGKDTTDPDSDDRVLKCLTLPQLEALSLSMYEISLGDLSSFLTRSSPPLRELVLGTGFNNQDFSDPHGLDQFLRLMPTLTHFEVSWPKTRDPKQLFATLALSSPFRFLPALQSLIVKLHPRAHDIVPMFCWEPLLHALTSRSTTIQIVHVKLGYATSFSSSKPAANILAAFRELVADGMDVYIGAHERNLISL